ncbi:hypothetical protein BC2230_11645 [Burkholderia cepacia]
MSGAAPDTQKARVIEPVPFAFTALAKRCGKHIDVGGWNRRHRVGRGISHVSCSLPRVAWLSISWQRAHGLHEYCVAGSPRLAASQFLTFMD